MASGPEKTSPGSFHTVLCRELKVHVDTTGPGKVYVAVVQDVRNVLRKTRPFEEQFNDWTDSESAIVNKLKKSRKDDAGQDLLAQYLDKEYRNEVEAGAAQEREAQRALEERRQEYRANFLEDEETPDDGYLSGRIMQLRNPLPGAGQVEAAAAAGVVVTPATTATAT